MRERIPHVLSTIKNTSTPSNLLFFDTETRDNRTKHNSSEEYHRLWFGYAIAYRYEDARRTRFDDCIFDTIRKYWDFCISRLDKKRPLNIYCHNAAFDLTIVDFWRKCEKEKWDIDFAVLESPPVIISVATPYGRLNIIDTVNYFKVPLKTLGESVGLPKMEIDIEKATYEQALPYCKRDCEIIARSMDRLIDFVRTNRLGKLGPTVASLALSAYRHRFMKHYIYIHDRERVLKLERDSYHGGMVNCLFVGKVRDQKVYKLDVNSLYPTVMRNQYPVKLLYGLNDPSISYVKNELNRKAVIADITLSSKANTYPVVQNKELIFATGVFRSVLCGPELQRAILLGDVKRIHYAAFYDLAPIFREYVDFFWEKRLEYKQKDDKANQTFCKYLLNSLYGKFAQGHYEWTTFNYKNLESILRSLGHEIPTIYEKRANLPILKAGQIPWIPLNTNETIKLRKIGSLEQIQQRTGWHPESFVGIASYVTSYARRYLMSLLEIAGSRNCYYYDTDSLFVNAKGKRNLERAGKCSDVELGGLKIEGSEYEPTFLAPKDYIFGEDICLKGIRKNAKRMAGSKYKQLQFEGLPSIIRRGCQPYITIKQVIKTVTHKYKKGIVNPDGWTRPFCLPEDMTNGG